MLLGIESTAHTFGVGIVHRGKVLANEKSSYTTQEGGIIPWDAAQHHVDNCAEVAAAALAKAKVNPKELTGIAFSQGPGIGHSLRIGALAARCLARTLGIPLVGVNHCIAHLEIGKQLTGMADPVLLYVSGGNTQVIACDAGKNRIFGETLDIGIGNLLDAYARHLGLGFPGGPKIAALAASGKKFVALPYVVKGMDLSFGGLLTHMKRISGGEHAREDLCYSLQETVFAMCCEVSERAMAHAQKGELVLGGGVGCNTRLQEMCRVMCEDRGARAAWPANEFLVDNGAMIALLGEKMLAAGLSTPLEKSVILPYQRTDEVEVTW